MDGPGSQYGSVLPPSGATSTDIAFSGVGFTGQPSVVLLNLSTPGATAPTVKVRFDYLTLTAAGFTARYTAPLPSAGFVLSWLALI